VLPLIFINTHPIQYFAPLYRYLTEQGFALKVWYCSNKSIRGEIDPEFNTTVHWNVSLLDGYAYQFFENTSPPEAENGNKVGRFNNPGLIAALKAEPPSAVVVTAWNYTTALQVLRKARRYGHQLLFRGETNFSHELRKPFLARQMRRLLLPIVLRHVQAFLYIGQESLAFYEHLGLPQQALYYTPYVVDNERFQQFATTTNRQQARQTLGLPTDAKILLFSGKFIAKKRPLDVIDAFAGATQTALLVMMGEGALRPQLEQRIVEKGLQGRVLLTGFVNQQEVPAYYRAADFLVMSSDVGETWGLSVNEGMNFGLPLLVSHMCGCQKNLVQSGKNGFVYRAGDVQALHSLINTMLHIPQEKYDIMSKASVEIVDNHSFVQVAAGFRKALMYVSTADRLA